MKNLDRIAAQHFEKYAQQITPGAKWRYLSKERQKAWREEIGYMMLTCLEQVAGDIEMKLPTSTGQVSFEKGFLAGEAHENKRLKSKLIQLKEFVKEQLEATNADSKN